MNILNTALNALGGGGDNPLMSIVTNMLSDQDGGGGIGGLLAQFQQNGLGEAAQSWIGSGENASVSADQIAQAFGSDKIASMAEQAGISTGDLAGQLSQLLPQAVDQLTPDGEVPSGAPDLGSLASVLGGLLGK